MVSCEDNIGIGSPGYLTVGHVRQTLRGCGLHVSSTWDILTAHIFNLMIGIGWVAIGT